jgi:hypothetical protein
MYGSVDRPSARMRVATTAISRLPPDRPGCHAGLDRVRATPRPRAWHVAQGRGAEGASALPGVATPQPLSAVRGQTSRREKSPEQVGNPPARLLEGRPRQPPDPEAGWMPAAMGIYSLLSLFCHFSVGIVSQNAGRSHPGSARMCASCSSLAYLDEVCVVGASVSPLPCYSSGDKRRASQASNPPASAARRPPIIAVHGGRHAQAGARCAGGRILARSEAGAQQPGLSGSCLASWLGAWSCKALLEFGWALAERECQQAHIPLARRQKRAFGNDRAGPIGKCS